MPRQPRSTVGVERTIFVGRRREIEALDRRFADGARLVSLLGPGGVGKTRLAQRYARLSASRYPGGTWFCALSDVRTADGLEQELLATLGLEMTDGVAIPQALRQRGRTLVVLDNFEQLESSASASSLARWLDGAPECRFLVTSRRVLHIAGEHRLAVGPLGRDDGLALFTATAAAVAPDMDLSGGRRAVLESIVEALDGLPLAIELAASRLPVLAPEEIRQRLSDRFTLLRTSRGDGEARHATLEATLDWSSELLAPQELSAFERCSVFVGGFDLCAAEQVLDEHPAASALDLVQALTDRCLLRALPDSFGHHRRFDMLHTVRAYARRRLRHSASCGEVERRHAEHYASRMAPERDVPLQELALERGNLAAVVERFGRSRPSLAASAALALEPLLRTRGGGAHHLAWTRETIGLAEASGDANLVAHARLRAVRVAAVDGDLDRAEAELAALDGGSGADEAPVALERARTKAMLRRMQRRLPEALDCCHDALRRCRDARRTGAEGHVLRDTAVIHMLAGRTHDAATLYRRALEAHRACGERQAEAIVLCDLGVLHLDACEEDEAERLLNAALEAQRSLDDRGREAVVLSNLAVLDHQRGCLVDSRERWQRSLALHREIGNRRFEGFALGGLGTLALEEGHLVEAAQALEASVARFREVADDRWGGWATARLAVLHAACGDTEVARKTFAEARSLLSATDPSWWQPALEILEGVLDPDRTPLDEASGPPTSATKIARRLRAALHRSMDSAPPTASDKLRVGSEALWVEPPRGPRRSLAKRPVARRLLGRLVAQRIAAPGSPLSAAELVAAGWPGERMRADSAAARLYTAVRSMRSELGLHDVLVTTRGGYLLHPAVGLEQVD